MAGSGPEARVLRPTSDGTTDTTFGGGDGILTYNLGYDDFAMGSAVVYQGGGATGQGRLVIAGGVSTGSFNTALVGLKLGGQAATATYYSKDWQGLEERGYTQTGSSVTVSGTAKAQNVWSTVYVDAFAARDEDITSASDDKGRKYYGNLSGDLERRLHFQQDANFNVTSLVLDTIGTSEGVVEFYTQTPYGVPTVRNASWTVISSSAYSNFYGHQGGKIDAATSLVYFRYRDHNPGLGRWITKDPSVWPDGVNRSEADRSNPVAVLDPLGTEGIIGNPLGNFVDFMTGSFYSSWSAAADERDQAEKNKRVGIEKVGSAKGANADSIKRELSYGGMSGFAGAAENAIQSTGGVTSAGLGGGPPVDR